MCLTCIVHLLSIKIQKCNYVPQTKFGETCCVCSVSYYYYSSSFFLSSAKSLSDTFLEIDETCQEQHPHLVEQEKPKKSESVGQTLPRLPQKQKREDLKKFWIPFIKLHETLQEYPPQQCVAAFGWLKKFKMAAVAMVTKVQKMLNSNCTANPFET